jgi:hypothetical protein
MVVSTSASAGDAITPTSIEWHFERKGDNIGMVCEMDAILAACVAHLNRSIFAFYSQ